MSLFVVTAIVLCFLLEAVIVALVHVLLGVLLCAIWPSSTAAAIASLILRPAATIDRNPATPSASEEPPRDVRVGDCVVRRGELCTVIAIDRSVVPIGVTVQNQKTGMVAHTELAFLSLPADCTATPPPTLPPPRLPLLRLLMLPLYAVALTSLAVLTRAVMLPLYLLRFTNLVRLIRLIGRSYRSDEAGDGPATQVVCNGRGGQECRSPNRPALVHVKGINKKTGEKGYRSWCKACHLAKPATHRCPPTKPRPEDHTHLDGHSINSESEMDSMGDWEFDGYKGADYDAEMSEYIEQQVSAKAGCQSIRHQTSRSTS